MRFKILGILAAVAFVSACETASTDSGATSGGGIIQAKPVEQFTTPLGGASARGTALRSPTGGACCPAAPPTSKAHKQ